MQRVTVSAALPSLLLGEFRATVSTVEESDRAALFGLRAFFSLVISHNIVDSFRCFSVAP